MKEIRARRSDPRVDRIEQQDRKPSLYRCYRFLGTRPKNATRFAGRRRRGKVVGSSAPGSLLRRCRMEKFHRCAIVPGQAFESRRRNPDGGRESLRRRVVFRRIERPCRTRGSRRIARGRTAFPTDALFRLCGFSNLADSVAAFIGCPASAGHFILPFSHAEERARCEASAT